MLSTYIASVIKLAVLASVLVTISHKRTRNTARFAVGIILISAIMLPFVDIMQGLNADLQSEFDFSYIDEPGIGDEIIESKFEKGIAEYIAQRYGIDAEEITVGADGFDMSVMRAERIYISIGKNGIFIDYRQLEDIIEEEFTNGGRCEVELNVG